MFLLGNTCTALQTVDVQELVTVQQMTNVWKLCETGGGTANCLAIQVFFLELFFEET